MIIIHTLSRNLWMTPYSIWQWSITFAKSYRHHQWMNSYRILSNSCHACTFYLASFVYVQNWLVSLLTFHWLLLGINTGSWKSQYAKFCYLIESKLKSYGFRDLWWYGVKVLRTYKEVTDLKVVADLKEGDIERIDRLTFIF